MRTTRKYSIEIDFAKETKVALPQFIQGDTNILEFTVLENDVVSDLSDLGKVVVNFKRPDKRVISRLLVPENDALTYTLGADEMETAGLAYVELQFYSVDNLQRLSTAIMRVQLVPGIGTDAIVENDESLTLLQSLFVEVESTGDYALAQGDYAKAQGDAIDTKVATAVPTAVDEKVGLLSNLQTADKASVVGAVNEVSAQLAENANYYLRQQQGAFSKYRKPPLAILGTFEPDETWERLGGTASDVVADTINHKYGTQGLKITSQNNTTVYAQRTGVSFNLTEMTHVEVSIYSETPNNFQALRLYLYSGTNHINTTTKLIIPLKEKWQRNNWITLKLSKSDFTTSATAPDLSLIDKILIEVQSKVDTTTTVTIDKLIVCKAPTTRGKVTLRFDDGFKNVYDSGKPILDKYGYRGVFAIIASVIGDEDRVSVSELHTMQEQGWDIVNHTWSHIPLDTASESTAKFEIDEGRKWLDSNGFLGSRHAVLPGHLTNSTVQKFCGEENVSTGAGVEGYDTLPPADQQALKFLKGDGVGAATLKSYIDKCEANKDWITILFHQVKDVVDPYVVTPSDLEALVDYIATKNVDVVTLSDLTNGNFIATL